MGLITFFDTNALACLSLFTYQIRRLEKYMVLVEVPYLLIYLFILEKVRVINCVNTK